MDPLKLLVFSNAITLMVLLGKIIWDMTRSETRDLTIAMKENTAQIIKLSSQMEYASVELKKLPDIVEALGAIETTIAVHNQKLERIDKDLLEIRQESKRGRRQHDHA